MYIDPKFKVQTIDAGGFKSDTVESDTSTQDQNIKDYFLNPSTPSSGLDLSPDSTTNTNDIHDPYTMGDMTSRGITVDENGTGEEWLTSFPPTPEEIFANNDYAAQNPEELASRYEKAKVDILKLRDAFITALSSSDVTASEREKLNTRVGLIDTKVLPKIDVSLLSISQLSTKIDASAIEEFRLMKDLDGDHHIGRRGFAGSLGVVTVKGVDYLIDPITKNIVSQPTKLPDFEPRLTTNTGIELKSHGTTATEKADVVLGLSSAAFTNSSPYGTAYDISIPEVLYRSVKADEWGNKKLYDGWAKDDSKGIYQKVPDNLSKYEQVKITKVEVESVAVTKEITNADGTKSRVEVKSENGTTLYHHKLVLYNGEDKAGVIRLEGMEGGPAAATLEGGGSYTAASSVGLSINGDNRLSPLELDASGLKSTGKHSVADLQATLTTLSGATITPPTATEEDTVAGDKARRGNAAFDENLTKAISSGNTDQFIESTTDTTGTTEGAPTTLLGQKSGLFTRGIYGDITGTEYNDVFQVPDMNWYSEDMKQYKPEHAAAIKKGDPLYSTRVDGRGGNNVMVGGTGDHYFYNASFAWITTENTDDENFITTPDSQVNYGYSTAASGNIGASSSINPKSFVHIGGGHAYVYNPSQLDQAALQKAASKYLIDAQKAYLAAHPDATLENDPNFPTEEKLSADIEREINKLEANQHNDYYECVAGSAAYSNTDAIDIVGEHSQGMTLQDILSAAEEPMSDWWDAVTEIPAVNAAEIQSSWDDVMLGESEMFKEMDSFFEEMFGGTSQIFEKLGLTNITGTE